MWSHSGHHRTLSESVFHRADDVPGGRGLPARTLMACTQDTIHRQRQQHRHPRQQHSGHADPAKPAYRGTADPVVHRMAPRRAPLLLRGPAEPVARL